MQALSFYDEKQLRLILVSGEIFEGSAEYGSPEYCLNDYGREEAALILRYEDSGEDSSWLFYERDLADIILLPKDTARPDFRIHYACQEDFITTRWAGGSTSEYLIYPRHAAYRNRDFLWRISSATVEQEESDFTPLPDYYRYITPLKGSMSLSRNGAAAAILKPYDIHFFDGADHTRSRGTCRDFNLMLRKSRAEGSLQALALSDTYQPLPLKEDTRDLLLFCPEADLYIHTPWSEIFLPAGEMLLAENPGKNLLSAKGPAGARLLTAQAGPLPKG